MMRSTGDSARRASFARRIRDARRHAAGGLPGPRRQRARAQSRAHRSAAPALLAATLGLAMAACDGEADPLPVFPVNADNQWAEMRDCRHSHEHELRHIRVYASRSAEAPYAALSPDVPYPEGAVLVKFEYDDPECTELVGFTALKKLAPDSDPAAGDWLWQRLGPDQEVIEEGALPRCIDCHEEHCMPPYGYDLTCAEEL